MSFPAARFTDTHICSMCFVPPGLPIIPPCAITVLTGGLPQARMGDLCACIGPPPAAVDAIVFGSPTVLVMNQPAARMLDPTAKGGIITKGQPNVLIGIVGAGGSGGGMHTMPGLNPRPVCISLAAELAENQTAQDMAAMSAAAYLDGEGGDLPANTRRATQADLEALGLHDGTNDLTAMPDSDFNADVFVHTNPVTGEETYTVAFEGTTPDSGGDWGANVGQGVGMETEYYRRANEIGRTASASQPGKVRYTGHSLGGGMASAAATASGDPAYTFNAAGLHENTMEGGDPNADVQAYYLRTDPLNAAQDARWSPMPEAFGNRREMEPTAIWADSDRVPREMANPDNYVPDFIEQRALDAKRAALEKANQQLRFHSIEEMQRSLEAQEQQIRQEQQDNGCT
ncbi:PAAR motif-containing protein [Vannielia litorea]|uniref:PAAR motif-containing protein n=2 Tax=Vannielia litorea TaxID=1217970 RepID=A0A1N6F176_9RHOB|nr:PAAR domain-containing protein [Vannielia litorea]SIN89058.1 PAAR motif-containing protein [Vannielia litorea]